MILIFHLFLFFFFYNQSSHFILAILKTELVYINDVILAKTSLYINIFKNKIKKEEKKSAFDNKITTGK
jgi:hypothetical protein